MDDYEVLSRSTTNPWLLHPRVRGGGETSYADVFEMRDNPMLQRFVDVRVQPRERTTRTARTARFFIEQSDAPHRVSPIESLSKHASVAPAHSIASAGRSSGSSGSNESHAHARVIRNRFQRDVDELVSILSSTRGAPPELLSNATALRSYATSYLARADECIKRKSDCGECLMGFAQSLCRGWKRSHGLCMWWASRCRYWAGRGVRGGTCALHTTAHSSNTWIL